MTDVLTQDLAESFARIALGHVSREYPNKLDHVLAEPGDVLSPRVLHPVFFGSFDWHSCVHGFWLLARLLRRFPAMAAGAEIRALLDARLTPALVTAECAYLERPASRGFERPYGWGWLLKLAAELGQHREHAWGRNLEPLAAVFAQRFRAFLPLASYPVRAGQHGNTAFALLIASDYASACDPALMTLFVEMTHRWYGEDRHCPAWEPDGEDFLSPALTEAACMQAFLAPPAFRSWFDGFLPDLHESRPACLFTPVTPSDRTDGRLAHLDGLNFSRAWCWRLIAGALAPDDPRRDAAIDASHAHLRHSLPYLAVDYMGVHWLASFALLALDAKEAAWKPSVPSS